MAAKPFRSFTVVSSRDLRYLVSTANFCSLHRLFPPAVHLVETRARLSVQVPKRRHCQRTLTNRNQDLSAAEELGQTGT